VAKYAEASQASITLSHDDGHVTFTITDDGRGFDMAGTTYGTGLRGIADRLAALGGELSIASTPGSGTRVTGRLPAEGLPDAATGAAS